MAKSSWHISVDADVGEKVVGVARELGVSLDRFVEDAVRRRIEWLKAAETED